MRSIFSVSAESSRAGATDRRAHPGLPGCTDTLPVFDMHIPILVPGLSARLADGMDVLHVGSQGILTLLRLAQRYTNSRFTIAMEARGLIEFATSARRSCGNVSLVHPGDRPLARVEGQFDIVFCLDAKECGHSLSEMLALMREMLKPDGIFVLRVTHSGLSTPTASTDCPSPARSRVTGFDVMGTRSFGSTLPGTWYTMAAGGPQAA